MLEARAARSGRTQTERGVQHQTCESGESSAVLLSEACRLAVGPCGRSQPWVVG